MHPKLRPSHGAELAEPATVPFLPLLRRTTADENGHQTVEPQEVVAEWTEPEACPVQVHLDAHAGFKTDLRFTGLLGSKDFKTASE